MFNLVCLVNLKLVQNVNSLCFGGKQEQTVPDIIGKKLYYEYDTQKYILAAP